LTNPGLAPGIFFDQFDGVLAPMISVENVPAVVSG
jgi:hypothetical protein